MTIFQIWNIMWNQKITFNIPYRRNQFRPVKNPQKRASAFSVGNISATSTIFVFIWRLIKRLTILVIVVRMFLAAEMLYENTYHIVIRKNFKIENERKCNYWKYINYFTMCLLFQNYRISIKFRLSKG